MSSSPTSSTATAAAAAIAAPSSKPASPSTDSAPASAPGPGPAAAHQQPQAAELGVYVDTLIKQLQSKFDDMSGHIISKIDTMADRLDDLEKSIAELMQNAEAAASPTPGDVGTSASRSSSRPASVAGGHGVQG